MNHTARYLKTLLIAEDNISNAVLLKSSVGRDFREVLQAYTGLEAVDLFRSKDDIGLVLMDISMPEMTGYEAIRIIRRMKPDIPVIALTAYINDETVCRIKESGFTDYLIKPFHLNELVEMIRMYAN